MKLKIFTFILVGFMFFGSYGVRSFSAETGCLIQEDQEIVLLKEKQMNTMKDIATLSVALTDYVTDFGVTPEHEGSYDEKSKFYQALIDYYLKIVPIKDAWGNNFQVFCGEAANGKYGIAGCASDDFVVVSFGRDGKMEEWKYNKENPGAGLFYIEFAEDFDKDLIMWNGSWVRSPMARRN